MTDSRKKILYLVELAILTALVIVLQFLGTFLTGFTGLPMSLVLIPIVIGAIHLGPGAGAWLGGVFGVVTIVMGFSGGDAFTNILLNKFGIFKMFACVVLCMVKAVSAGLGAGFIYKWVKALNKNKTTVATILASISAPVINTGIFVIGMLLFYFNDLGVVQTEINTLYNLQSEIVPSLKYIFLVLAGWNFVSEFIINLTISPAVSKVVEKVRKNRK